MDYELQPLDDGLDRNFELLFSQFNISLTSLQVQDLNSSEQALLIAKNVYRNITLSDEAEDKMCLIMVNFIEVTTRVLRTMFYNVDERYQKSLLEFEESKKICNSISLALKEANKYSDDEEINSMFLMFKFLFSFFERIISVGITTTKGIILKEEGKYLDEVAMYRSAAEDLKQINNHDFGVLDFTQNEFAVLLIGMLNRIADMHEKKAERLENKKRKIEFLNPNGNRVFIVHGHNTGILLELKEILKTNYKLDPIILNDESDEGNTVIEKFEKYGRYSSFAFVIVTPDDWVENKKKKYFQSRPNVLFELGWFCGRYGRDKVRILRQKDTPLPSDLNGIVTIDFNEKLEEVFRRIGKDLENAGVLQKEP